MTFSALAAHEENGKILVDDSVDEETLDVIGDYFDHEAATMTERLLAVLEPVIIIVLAAVTVMLLLAVYLPMFSMYGSM